MPKPPRPPVSARRVLRRLERAIADLGTLVLDEGPEWTFEELAAVYAHLDRAGSHTPGDTQQLAVVRDAVRHLTARAYPGGSFVVVEGIGVLELCSLGKRTAWDGPRLARTIAARIADEHVDRLTGEVRPIGVTAERIASALIDAAGLDNQTATFRKTSLGLYGLDADDFTESVPGRLSVRFTD